MRLVLLLGVMAAAGCAGKRGIAIDPTLPDGAAEVEHRHPDEVLAVGAGDDDPNLRARALGLLIRTTEEPGGGAWALRALYDPDPWVQRSGLEALTPRLDEPETVALLESYVSADLSTSDPYVRGGAVMRLAAAGHTGTRDVVMSGWRAESLPWRAAPLQLAAAVMGDAEAVAPLAKTLSRGDLPLEVEFVLDVGRSRLDELVPALREGSEWLEPEMELPFAVARVSLGDAAGEGPLRKALMSGDDIRQLEALDYLSKLRDPAADALLRKARSEGSELARWYAELALLARGEGNAERLEKAMANEDREVRTLAVRFATDVAAFESRKSQRTAKRVVRAALFDDDASVRTEAVRATAALGLNTEAEGLIVALSDEFFAIRVEAAGAILLLGK
jgi:HEAT repeat protein